MFTSCFGRLSTMNFADSDFLMGKNVSKFFQTCIDKFVDE